MCPKIVEGASHESLNKEKELMWKKHYGQGYVQESCWRWDARASLKPGVSHLSSGLLKSISLLYFSKQSICVFVIRFFLNTHRKNKIIPSRNQHTNTCCQEWNSVCTFCMMLLLLKKLSQRVNIIELLSIIQEIFNLVNFNSKLH